MSADRHAIGYVPPPSPRRKAHPANGMFAEVHLGDGAYMSIVDPKSHEDGGAEWVLRYGDPETIRYSVASAISSYDYLMSGAITTAEAIRRLRILRGVARDLASGVHDEARNPPLATPKDS